MSASLPNFTPFIPSDAALTKSSLPDKAIQFTSASAQLSGQIAPQTKKTIERHMSVINSYYSNLIEGNRTLPHEIRAAQAGDFSNDPAKRDLQLESIAHIHVQQWINDQNPNLNTLYSPEFLQNIHREFYQQVPQSLHQIKNVDGKFVETISPGEWRTKPVIVGQHIAPESRHIPALMHAYCEQYHPDRYSGDRKLIAVMCAHHRLGWIHPFSDGNGRVMRLFTDAALKAIGMESTGIWHLSRGLARKAAEYKSALARADFERYGDYDGRGVLSEKTLISFCEFMLDTGLDQMNYMHQLLAFAQMLQRIQKYVQARNDGRILNLDGIKENAVLILHYAFTNGKISRAMAIRLCGMPDRSARRLLAQLRLEGLLSETSSRSDLRWEIPEHAEPWYFPQLSPEG